MVNQIVRIITEKRSEIGMTRVELSKRTGISYNQLITIEKGTNVKIETLEKILRALGIKKINLKINQNEED